ncbi:hypothetical protein [Luteibacter sp.]|uniref:hypothetical protein n=1 Tax=Luteibacter sp. TaxID=1886636 RepID=UPI003F7DA41D
MRRSFPWLLSACVVMSPFADAAEAVAPVPVVITVGDDDDPEVIRRDVLGWLDEGRPVALAGRPVQLARVRLEGAQAWPATNTIVLDPSAGLGISGFDADDDASRRLLLAAWPWAMDVLPASPARDRREAPVRARQRHVEFSVPAASPGQVCRAFAQQVATTLFGADEPTPLERRAFRRAVRRWCQYGTLSLHLAARPQFTIEPFGKPYDVRLTIATEWALVRSEDIASAGSARYLFWTKTLNEGAAGGFSRIHGTDAWYDPATGVVHNLMDVAIHAGWGRIEGRELVTAWPLNSSFPQVGNVLVFRCDDLEAWRPPDCPVAPVLKRLLPEDSADGLVTVASGETVSVGGDAKMSRSFSEDKISTSFTFGVNLMRATSKMSQVELSLVHTRSNADTVFYRSTWWLPDVPAIFRWIDARKHAGSLAKASPLATSLNPHHEMVWELPLAGNEGRDFEYHMVYEAGWNACRADGYCSEYRRGKDPAVPPKERGAWVDGITIHLPWR